MKHLVFMVASLMASVGIGSSVAGPPAGVRPSQLGQPNNMVNANGEYSPLAISRVTHLARVMGSRATASGTRYFAATDQTLAGTKNSAELLRRLAPPPITTDERVRRVESVVDVRRHLVARAPRSEPARIGAVLIGGDAPVEVQSYLSISDLTLVGTVPDENK